MTSARLRELLPVLEAHEQGREVEWACAIHPVKRWHPYPGTLELPMWFEMQNPSYAWRIKPRVPREFYIIERPNHPDPLARVGVVYHEPIQLPGDAVVIKVREVL